MNKSFATKIDVNIIETLKELSEDTRIPQTKLVVEAFQDLFKKYGKEIKKEKEA